MGGKELICGSLLWLLIIMTLAPFILILFLWKGLIILVVKCIRQDLRVLGPQDLTSPGGTDKTVVNAGFSCVVEGSISLEDLQRKFTDTFLRFEENGSKSVKRKYQYDKFHSDLVAFGGIQFAHVLPKIEISDQIYVKHLSEDTILEDFLSEWLLTKYKPNSALWEIILIPLKSTNQTVMAFKIHHAFADGYSLVYILDKLTSNTSPYLVKDFQDSYVQEASQMLQAACHLKKLLPPSSKDNPLLCTEEETHRWSIGFTRLNLDLLKNIRRRHDVQMSVLIMSLFAGVFRKYLLKTKKIENLPSHMSFGTAVPWPKHPAKNLATPLTDRMCNHWATGYFRVPITGDNPLERLMEAQQSFKEFQNCGLSKLLRRFIIPLTWLLPPALFSKLLFAKGYSGVYTAWVGGKDYKLMDKSISRIHPIGAINDFDPTIPLGIASFSHGNNLEISFNVNPQNFPTRKIINQVLNDHLPTELETLRKLSGINID